ncbi:MAG TPA: hypothetical protein VMT46_08715 [Anaerolineaceae bacterium]|nr:hypothetical protein [Anaerolineaceae bacterium]
MATKIKINRAPVLTLWATVVAERMGFPEEAALTLGKALAGLNAQSKGQRLGIYEPAEEKPEKKEKRKESAQPAESVRILGRPVPVVETAQGLRATESGRPIDPGSVERYLERKFKGNLNDVKQAMQELAGSLEPAALERRGFGLYEEFRPEVPEGTRGWGATGELDLDRIRDLEK